MSCCGWKSLRELLHLGPETSTKCADYEQKKSAESSYYAYKAWLKNESSKFRSAGRQIISNEPWWKFKRTSLANFNEQTKQKVNSIKEKYGKKPEAHNGTTTHK
ncbi:unnamed protein product, partial [Mesorhabditis spiculigera]